MFAIVDCNNFYASCERLFRPDLLFTPIVVLSNNDGCCIARSYEAKMLGIMMGAPYFKIKALCKKNKVAVFSSNYTLYGNISYRVMTTIKNTWPDIEVYSIDEAFLDLSRLPSSQVDRFCINLQRKILQHTGIPTSIGIGKTKTLAKAASLLAKRHKSVVFNISDRQEEYLKKIAISEVWGIGQGWFNRLTALGITTAFDLAKFNTMLLPNIILVRTAVELQGIVCNGLVQPQAKQNILCSKSFGAMQSELSGLKEALSSYCMKAVAKMRKANLVTKQLRIFIASNRFRSDLMQYKRYKTIRFINPTDDIRLITKTANLALQEIYKKGIYYKKAGVYLEDLINNNLEQFDLFNLENKDNKTNKFMQVFDEINNKYG